MWTTDDFAALHNAAARYRSDTLLSLSILTTIPAPSPDVHIAQAAVGVLGGTLRIVFCSGTLLTSEPTSGTVSCVETDGTPVWIYNSPSNDYGMGIDVGDLDGAGVNEVVAGFRLQDHAAIALSGAGEYQWTYDNGANNYVRGVKISEMQSGHVGKEVVICGADGTLALLDQSGAQIWKVALTDTYYNTVQGIWIVDIDGDCQNEILVACGESVRLHRASDGAEIWNTAIGGDTNYTYGVTAGHVTVSNAYQVIAPTQFSGVHVLDQSGNLIWSQVCEAEIYSVAVGDVDGDGLDEVIIGYGQFGVYGGIRILDHDGHRLGLLALPDAVKFVLFSDVDGDGVGEILASCDNGNLYVIKIG